MSIIIRRAGDQDHDKTFCVFTVRVNSDKSTAQRKLLAGVPYHLMKGFCIEGNVIKVNKNADTQLKDCIFNQSHQNQTTRAHLRVSWKV